MAVSSDSPITAVAPPGREAPAARPAPPPQIIATDGELLGQFTRQGDRDALDRLVDRHSAMVWRVCRATLRRPQDVEDAFQATFLLLTKNARSIKSSESAAGWLYRVAYRTSLRARKKLSARREEALAVDPQAPSETAFPDLLQKQTTGVLVEELMRLPAKYQTPLVLRYLEGQSRRAIADQTDTTIAGVQGRLARGKQLLRRRLLRRGVSLAAVMGALGLGARGAAAAENAPARVVVQTTSNSAALATGGSVAASSAVVSLYRQGVNAMFLAWLSKPAVAAATVAIIAALFFTPSGGSALPVGYSAEPKIAAALYDDEPQKESLSIRLAQDDSPKSTRRRSQGHPADTLVHQAVPPVSAGDSRQRAGQAIREFTVSFPADMKLSTEVRAEQQRLYAEQLRSAYQELAANNAVRTQDAMIIALEKERVGLEEEREALALQLDYLQKQSAPGNERDRKKADAQQKLLSSRIIQVRAKREQIVERLKELATLSQTASRQGKSSEKPPVETPQTGVGGLPKEDSVASGSGAKMKVKVGEPAELSIDTPDKNHRLRLRYEPAEDGKTATVQLIESTEPPARPAAPNAPEAPKKVASRGIMTATDAAKLRASRDDLVFEDYGDQGVNGEPLIRVTEMVDPEVHKERKREAQRIEMNAAAARAKAHEMKLKALIAEMRSVAHRDQEVLRLAGELLLARNRKELEETRAEQHRRNQESAGDTSGGARHQMMNRAYGYSVAKLQEALNRAEASEEKIDVDGDYGPLTARAVAQYQRRSKLPITGLADAATRTALGLDDPAIELPLGQFESPLGEDDGLMGLAHQVRMLGLQLKTDLDKRLQAAGEQQGAERTPYQMAIVQARFDKINAALRRLGIEEPIELEIPRPPSRPKQLERLAPPAKPLASRAPLQPVKSDKKPSEPPKAERPKWPVIVESVPEQGATDVDPDLTEVRVTFDRDMQRGMSWTGGRKSFMPDVPQGARARWIDSRTCVLPVALKKGEFYRVGINAKSYQNFKSTDGVSAAHGAIAFATKGAKRSVARRARTPKVVEMAPADGDTSVNPGVTKLRVTFDMKMGGGMSWTNTKAAPFPDTGGGRATWSRDGRTCTLPVKLEAGKAYAVGLNASHAVNFQSEYGVPLEPVVWKFATGESLAVEEASRRHESSEELLAGTPPTGAGGSPSEADSHVEQLVAARAPGRIDHTDGRADGKKSLGGSGHLIRFELPEGAVGVKSVRIHGSRYGTKTAPREDFEISFLSEDRSEILDIRRGAYGLFRRGEEKWTNVRFKEPVIDLPETFWVAIDFNPGRTKGVYLSYDSSTGGERSMTGLAQQEPGEHKPVDFGGDWMVSAVLQRADTASLAPPGEATQPVAKTEASGEDSEGELVDPGIVLLPFEDDGRGAYGHKGREYGYSVSQLQSRLNEVLDPSPGLDVDDDYGPMTTRAVERFQREAGLAATGFADAATRDALGFIEPGMAKPPADASSTPQEEEAVAEQGEAPKELLDRLRATATYQSAPSDVQSELEKRLDKAAAEATSRRIDESAQHFIVGRVVLAEEDEPELVAAQMEILPGGFFFDLLGDALRPIGFRRHGYDPIDLVPPADLSRLADLGRIEMVHSAAEDEMSMHQHKLHASFVDEQGKRVRPRITIRQGMGPINTPSNGYEPRKRFAPPAFNHPVPAMVMSGFSPIAYKLTISAEGFVSQSRKIDFSEKNEIDLGEITLETPKEVELEYFVFRDRLQDAQVRYDDVDLMKPKRVILKPGEKFVSDPENMHQGSSDFRIEQKGGKLTFRSSYGPFYSTDLGEKELISFAGRTRTPLTNRDNPEIVDNHVYLLRSDYFDHHLLVRARVLKPGGGKMSELDRWVERYTSQLDAAAENLRKSELLRERAANAHTDAVRRVLTKAATKQAESAWRVCRSVNEIRLEGLENLAMEAATGDDGVDVGELEQLLQPISKLKQRCDELIESNWYVEQKLKKSEPAIK